MSDLSISDATRKDIDFLAECNLEWSDWRNGGWRLIQIVYYGLCQRAFKALDQGRRADEPRESS